MGADDSQTLQEQYTARWLKLKHLLTAKYFSDKALAGDSGVNDEVTSVAGVDVRLAQEPPLKRFLKTPRLKADLAKYLDAD
ncbi:hypothetical protein WJX81_008046 [Elliptochloris bilobata]|uniref:Uncharacterized protein n=1 Tax=Elliptochloris bilobata TaxID=381761 RepID=A0AAW1RPX3_9CHLO